MLSWSGLKSETEVDLLPVRRGRGDVGVAFSDELLQFATAAARLDHDLGDMGDARQALAAVAGQATMIDAAAVAANFHMMTRLADGTGARMPEARLEASAAAIASMGIVDLASRR